MQSETSELAVKLSNPRKQKLDRTLPAFRKKLLPLSSE
jgi:hypothetical protein